MFKTFIYSAIIININLEQIKNIFILQVTTYKNIIKIIIKCMIIIKY